MYKKKKHRRMIVSKINKATVLVVPTQYEQLIPIYNITVYKNWSTVALNVAILLVLWDTNMPQGRSQFQFYLTYEWTFQIFVQCHYIYDSIDFVYQIGPNVWKTKNRNFFQKTWIELKQFQTGLIFVSVINLINFIKCLSILSELIG